MRGGGGLASAFSPILGLAVTVGGAALVFVGGGDTAERQGLAVMLLGVAAIGLAAFKKR